MTTTVYTPIGVASLNRALRELAGPSVAEVRVTPVVSTRDGGNRRMWTVLALDGRGREVPLPGVAIRVVNLLRLAFPTARWGRAQDYRLATGSLTEHVTHLPAALTVIEGGKR